MLLTFCINEQKEDAQKRLLFISAAHIVALQVEPNASTQHGVACDLLIYGTDSGEHWRVPLIGRNLTAFDAWQVYVEGQK
jgi:hypothetical protein